MEKPECLRCGNNVESEQPQLYGLCGACWKEAISDGSIQNASIEFQKKQKRVRIFGDGARVVELIEGAIFCKR